MGYRRVTVKITLSVTIDIDEGVPVQEVIDEMDYELTTDMSKATIIDTEMQDYEITESR